MKYKFQEKIIDNERYIKFDNQFEELRYKHGNWLIFLLIAVMLVIFIGLLLYLVPHINLLKSSPCQLCMEQGYQCIQMKYG